MAYEDEDEEHIEAVRRHNKALRKVHKALRNALKDSREYSDNLFLELCNTEVTDAETAMEKLWTLGEMQNICGPRDYETIVEVCLEKLGVTSPIDRS